MAHVHLSYLICFTERLRQWVLCFKMGALKLTVVFSQIDSKPASLDGFLLRTAYNSASYLGLMYKGLLLLIVYLLENAFLYEDFLQVTSQVRRRGPPPLAC